MTAAATAQIIDESYFGMNQHNPETNGVPNVSFSIMRINNDQFNTGGHGTTNVKWLDINTSNGVYVDGLMDYLVPLWNAQGKDVMYTFANAPNWVHTSTCPNDAACPCTSAARTCWPPDDYATTNTAWKTFVTHMVQRYDGAHGHGRVKYWEIWNEPNSANAGVGQFWYGGGGSNTQKDALAAMHCDAYPIITAVSGNVVVSAPPQGSSAGTFITNYLPRATGLAKCSGVGNGIGADIIGFHGYVGSGNLATVETTLTATIITAIKNGMAAVGLTGLPIWDTENGWGLATDYTNWDLRAAWVVRHLATEFSWGIGHSNWWSWDDSAQSQLYTKPSGPRCQTGDAWQQMFVWLNGAQFLGQASATGTIWSIPLLLASGHHGLLMWDTSKTTCTSGTCTTRGTCNKGTVAIDPQYLKYTTLDGVTTDIVSNQIQLGVKPVLVEDQTPLPSTPQIAPGALVIAHTQHKKSQAY